MSPIFNKLLLFLFISLQLSCSNQNKKNDITEEKNHLIKVETTKKKNQSKHYTKLDTIIIETERGEILKYEKAEYNQMIDLHPEFFSAYPSPPKISYRLSYDYENNECEITQDIYFNLYAHFLKKKNDEIELKKERKNIIDIYTKINSIFQRLKYGGTYFGHQYSRILGFAEYSLFRMAKDKKEFNNIYNISKQKSLYIESLQQLIKDENSIDFETIGEKNKLERLNDFNKTIDEIEELISNSFYLKSAQSFQYENYNYY